MWVHAEFKTKALIIIEMNILFCKYVILKISFIKNILNKQKKLNF